MLSALFLSAKSQNKPAYDMTVNGVKVIVQPSGNEIVEIMTVFKGGVQNYPAEKAGIESLAITALTECGTKNDSKNSFKDKLDKVSAEMGGSAGMDYSSVTLNCIKSDLDQVWPLYVDAITVPVFDTTEFSRIKQDAISGLKSQASRPDFAISKMAKETAFKGKDYAKSPTGEEETVSQLTAAETKAYYSSILTRSRMLIVVVGELDRSVIEQKIKQLTENIPRRQGSETEPVQLCAFKKYFYRSEKSIGNKLYSGSYQWSAAWHGQILMHLLLPCEFFITGNFWKSELTMACHMLRRPASIRDYHLILRFRLLQRILTNISASWTILLVKTHGDGFTR